MQTTPSLSMPITEPLAFLDAMLLFVIQVLISQNPDLLAPPEESMPMSRSPPCLRAARRLNDAVRELHDALATYRATLPETLQSSPGEDDIPF